MVYQDAVCKYVGNERKKRSNHGTRSGILLSLPVRPCPHLVERVGRSCKRCDVMGHDRSITTDQTINTNMHTLLSLYWLLFAFFYVGVLDSFFSSLRMRPLCFFALSRAAFDSSNHVETKTSPLAASPTLTAKNNIYTYIDTYVCAVEQQQYCAKLCHGEEMW